MTASSRPSMLPSLEYMALSNALYAIDNALGFLAAWCPHGGDSSRVIDYQAAEEARRLLNEARVLMVAARGL